MIKKMKIRSKLMIIFIVLFSFPILIASFVFTRSARDFAREKSLELNIQNMNYIGSAVDLAFNYIYNYSLYPPFDSSIHSYLSTDAESDKYYGLKRNATDSIILLPYTNSNIQGVSIWRNDGLGIQSGKNLTLSEEEKETLLEMNGNPLWTYRKNDDVPIICFSRLLRNPMALQNNLGYIKIRLDNKALKNAFSNQNDNSSVYFIMDQTGDIFYQSQEYSEIIKKYPDTTEAFLSSLQVTELEEKQKTSWYQENAKCYITPHKIAGTNWILFSISKDSFSMNLSTYLNRVFYLFLVISIPVCILLAIVFSAIILSPLKKMGQLMQLIEKENFSVHLDVNSNDELAVLAQQFNHMSDELADLYNRVYLGNIRLKEAQLSALQAQINPHFLYNTLDTIYWMSEFNHTKDVSSMISALSKLFRLSLSGDQNDRIPLSSELEHLECFLYIEKIRYDDQLDYSIEILDDKLKNHTADYMVLKLVLQPIAENAILHGIDQNGSGKVNISISIADDCILYEISNTGTADINRINRILKEPAQQTGSIGLSNIAQRLQLKYGETYGIICFSRDDCTVFQIRLPIQLF